jgi:hypothetical protein
MGDELMGAIGKTKLDDNDDISALLGQHPDIKKPAVKKEENMSEKKDDEKLKHNRSAKFTDLEVEHLDKIMLAIGTDKVSKALRWCLTKAWEAHGDEIEKIADQKRNIGTL